MKEIKTSENVEFDVIYAEGSRYHAKEGVLIEADGDRINLHLGTSRVAVVFAAVEALTPDILKCADLAERLHRNAMELRMTRCRRFEHLVDWDALAKGESAE